MSAFAMFFLKEASLLVFDRRRKIEEHNLKFIYGMDQIPCDTQMVSIDGTGYFSSEKLLSPFCLTKKIRSYTSWNSKWANNDRSKGVVLQIWCCPALPISKPMATGVIPAHRALFWPWPGLC
jgi:hypothetical protein